MSLVSVIVAVYNAEDTLERAMRSIAAQTHSDWELLIADDGSTDGTRALAIALAAELGERVIVLPEAPNGGPSAARNRALDVMRGEWVAFLDADDEFMPDRLERMLDAAGPETDAVVCRHVLIRTDATTLERGHAAASMTGAEALRQELTDAATPYLWDKMFRTSAVEGLRFADVRRAEDKIFNVAAFRRSREVRFMNDVLYRYFVLPTSLTWGRVAGVDETRTLNRLVAEAAGGDEPRALRTSNVAAWLNVAHQAMAAPDAELARTRSRECARNIRVGDIAATLRTRPPFGVAALALKLVPGLYARGYRGYARRRYGVGA